MGQLTILKIYILYIDLNLIESPSKPVKQHICLFSSSDNLHWQNVILYCLEAEFGTTVMFNRGSIVSLGLWCCCTWGKNKHLTYNSCPPVELALFRRASRKVLTDVSLFSPSPPVVMLWATMLWPPVNPACSPVTMAIFGCLTVMLCPLSTDWMPQVSISLPLLISFVRPPHPLFVFFCLFFWSPYVMFTGLNLLLWGDLPELDDSDNEDSESPSEEECIR